MFNLFNTNKPKLTARQKKTIKTLSSDAKEEQTWINYFTLQNELKSMSMNK